MEEGAGTEVRRCPPLCWYPRPLLHPRKPLCVLIHIDRCLCTLPTPIFLNTSLNIVKGSLRAGYNTLLWLRGVIVFARDLFWPLLLWMHQLLQGDAQILKYLGLVLLIVTGFLWVALLATAGTADCVFSLPRSMHIPRNPTGGRRLNPGTVGGINDQCLILKSDPASEGRGTHGWRWRVLRRH